MSPTDLLERPVSQEAAPSAVDEAGRENSLPLLVVAVAIAGTVIAIVLTIAAAFAPAGSSESSACGSAPAVGSVAAAETC